MNKPVGPYFQSRFLLSLARLSLIAVCLAHYPAVLAAESLDDRLQQLIGQHGLTGNPAAGREVPSIEDPVVQLGRALFFTKLISGKRDVACVSCHHPLLGGGDDLSLPVGVEAVDPDLLGPGRLFDHVTSDDPKVQPGPNVPRNSPTIFNVTLYRENLFHDGRVFAMSGDYGPGGEGQSIRTPESRLGLPDPKAGDNLTAAQARFPLVSIDEMKGHDMFPGLPDSAVREELAKRFIDNGEWTDRFRRAFDKPEAPIDEVINGDTVAHAIGEFQRSQLFVDTPWRRYVEGDSTAISTAAKRGAVLFLSSRQEGAGCAGCHSGDFFTDEQFYNMGMPQFGRGKSEGGEDKGRFEVTRKQEDLYAFRTPSLLNVSETAPYGHTGSHTNLHALINHHLAPRNSLYRYDYSLKSLPQFKVQNVTYPNARRNSLKVRETALNESKLAVTEKWRELDAGNVDDLVAFLETLTDPCLLDSNCLQPWISDEEKDGKDEHRLVAKFGDAESINPAMLASVGKTKTDSGQEARSWQAPENPEGRAFRTPAYTANCQFDSRGTVEATQDNKAELPLFSDVTEAMGLDHVRAVNDETWNAALFLMNVNAGEVAAGDIDGDCFPDLLFGLGNTRSAILYKNRGGQKFEALPDEWMSALPRLGNFPPDAFSEEGLDKSRVTYNRPHLENALFVDVNGDGWLDIFSGSVLVGQPQIYLNSGYGKFAPQRFVGGFDEFSSTLSASFGDIDGDGDLDAFLSHWSQEKNFQNHLWKNDGYGRFYPFDRQAGIFYAYRDRDFTFTPNFVDIDDDGREDLLVAGDFGESKVFRNVDGYALENVTDPFVITDQNGMGAAIGDYDNDGDLDWFVTSIWVDPDREVKLTHGWGTSGNRLYQNQGDGRFVDVTDAAGVREGYWGWGACMADFDNDGHLDIFHTNGYSYTGNEDKRVLGRYFTEGFFDEFEQDPSRLFMSDGKGEFKESSRAMGIDHTGHGRGITCFDYDRDGDMDILIANYVGAPTLYRNNSVERGSQHHYLTVKLVGKGGNSEGIGAKVYVTTGGRTQMRQMRFSNNFNSQNPVEVHFGLAQAATIDELKIVWPGHERETVLQNVAVDQYLVVRHPDLAKQQVAAHAPADQEIGLP